MAIWKSRHRHWDRHRHRHSSTNVVFTQYKSPLEIKVLYIFVKHVIVNKVATYTLGTCHFVRKCFRKCFDNFKKAAVQNPCRKHYVGVFFNEIAEVNSRPLVKKGLHQGVLPVNILELSVLLLEGLTWARLFWKNWELCTTGLQLYQDAGPP